MMDLCLTFSTGLLCHLDDACVSNPCNDGAVCDTNPLNGRAICTCPAGFVGGACNQDMDECSIGKPAGVCLGFFLFFFFVFSLSVDWSPTFYLQVPTRVSILGNVWTQRAPSSVSAVGDMPAHVVRLTSTNACPCPARMMPLAWTALESSPASACQVFRPVKLHFSTKTLQNTSIKPDVIHMGQSKTNSRVEQLII